VNRENKRKKYEKGYYKNHPCQESFTCKSCGRLVTPGGAGSGQALKIERRGIEAHAALQKGVAYAGVHYPVDVFFLYAA